jgi:hypothetical protein
MQYTNGPKTFDIGTGGVRENRLVKLSDGKTVVHNTHTSTDDFIGVTTSYGDQGGQVAVDLLNKPGTMEIVAAGAITSGATVYAADAGKIQALPAVAGTYRMVGKALEAASADGSIIEVLIFNPTGTTTVS